MAFEKLTRLINLFDSLKGGELAVRIIEQNKDLQVEILDLNRIGQLFNQGISSKGELIGVYSINTELFFDPNKKAGSHCTFKDTGQFFESFRILTAKDFFEITANPLRDGTNLFEKYTPDLVGLTDQSKEKLRGLMLPLIQDHIRNKLRTL